MAADMRISEYVDRHFAIAIEYRLCRRDDAAYRLFQTTCMVLGVRT
jgi:hypothetical protein